MARKNKEDLASVFHEAQLHDWKKKHAALNERYKHLLSQFHDTESRLSAILGLQDAIADRDPVRMKVRATGRRGESTAALIASDWHLEERVEPKTIDGLNEYNPKIAEERIKRFFERGLSMVEKERTRTRIDTLLLPFLGDHITGYIHDELAESNYLSPIEAILKAYGLMTGGIDFILKEGQFSQILIPCTVGNHGRTTKKMRIATATKTSYEWLLYHFAAMRYANEPRIKFNIADGYFSFAEIYSTTIRLHHGHGIKYHGGVGGVTIPLNKAIAQWNKAKKADLDVLGHWHERQQAKNFVINGSVIGYNAYAIQIKAGYELPCQSFFLIHPDWGKTVEIPIFLN